MRAKRKTSIIAAALVGALALITTVARAAEPLPPKVGDLGPAPRLILQITVDQLRGDLPGRFVKNMGEGGFRYLMNQGVWYASAHHAHANTETIVGHSTLATGADPANHGMIGNVWLDRETGNLTYNIEDPKYRVLTPCVDGTSLARAFCMAMQSWSVAPMCPACLLGANADGLHAIRKISSRSKARARSALG